MGEPEQLAAGMRRLASYAQRAGRDPTEIEVIYRTHRYELHKDGSSSEDRPLFTGSADQIAADIRISQEMRVSHLVVDFGRVSPDLDEMLRHMEEMATQVWPQV